MTRTHFNPLLRIIHWIIALLILAMPLIGWAMLSAGGYPVVVTKSLILPPILPHDLTVYFWLHTLLAIATFGLILVHLAAALMHGLIRRDGVLQSMTFGRSESDR